jgi:hypothetical protein
MDATLLQSLFHRQDAQKVSWLNFSNDLDKLILTDNGEGIVQNTSVSIYYLKRFKLGHFLGHLVVTVPLA